VKKLRLKPPTNAQVAGGGHHTQGLSAPATSAHSSLLATAVIASFFVAACQAVGASPAPSPTPSAPVATTPAATTAVPLSTTPASSPSPTLSPAPSVTIIHDSTGVISFDRPSNWVRWQPNNHDPMTGGPLIYLSTDSLDSSCAEPLAETPNPSNPQGASCAWPLTELSTNGVLIIWYTSRLLEPIPTGADELVVNGASTEWSSDQPGACSAIKADETVDVAIPIGQPAPLSNLSVQGCMRGPDLSVSETQLRDLLKSVTTSP
jgi:hypothetical protein